MEHGTCVTSRVPSAGKTKNATKHHKHEICIYHRPLTIKRLPQNSFKIKPSQHKTIGVPNDIQHKMLVTTSIVCLKLTFINKKVQFFSQYCHTAILVLNRSGIMRFNSWNLEQGVPCHYNSYNYQPDWQQVPNIHSILAPHYKAFRLHVGYNGTRNTGQ